MKQKPITELSRAEAIAMVQEMAVRLHQRSEPIVLATMETMEQWIAMAEDPGNPHYQAARMLIRRWTAIQERMRAIAAGIQVANLKDLQ